MRQTHLLCSVERNVQSENIYAQLFQKAKLQLFDLLLDTRIGLFDREVSSGSN